MRKPLPWRPYLAVCLPLAIAQPLSARLGIFDLWYFTIAFGSVAMVFWGLRHYRPRHALPWRLFGASMLATVTGALIQARTDDSGAFGQALGFADLFLTAGYALMVAAQLAFLLGPERRFPRAGFWEGLFISVGLVALCTDLLLMPTIYAANYTHVSLYRLSYPLMMTVSFGLLIWLGFARGTSSRSYVFLLSYGMTWFLSESIFHIATLSVDIPITVNFILWQVAYVLAGAAAMVPSMAVLQERKARVENVAPYVLVLFGVFGATPLVMSLAKNWIGLAPGVVTAAGVTILLLLILAFKIRSLAARLQTIATRDDLTGLGNRYLFSRVVEGHLRERRHFTLALVDIDHFKFINDEHGHFLSDRVIIELGWRFHSELAAVGGRAFRLGGDEFALLWPQRHAPDAEALGRLMGQVTATPFFLSDGVTTRLTLSVGALQYEGEDIGFDDVFKAADIALYRAKRDGRDRVSLYSPEFFEDVHKICDTVRVVQHLHETAARPDFAFQPLVRVLTGRIVAFEMLLRLKDETGRPIDPPTAVQAAEFGGMTGYLTQSSFDTACALLHQTKNSPVSVTVNLSRSQLLQAGMIEALVFSVERANTLLTRFIVEVSEAQFLEEEAVREVLGQLRLLGVRVALDDFGTGYSSLACLERLPVDIVKLDKGFLRNTRNPVATIAKIERICAAQGIEMVVEGVESEVDAEVCRSARVAFAQGYHFGRPMPLPDAVAQIAEGTGKARPPAREAPPAQSETPLAAQ